MRLGLLRTWFPWGYPAMSRNPREVSGIWPIAAWALFLATLAMALAATGKPL